MSQLTLVEGSIFAGRYKVLRCIAMGGMGAVYEVVHIETERRRALKVMLPHVVANEELRGRFRQEARVAAHIESEFIVDVFDAGVDESTQMPFLVMELLRGEELGKRLQRVGRFQPKEVITYLQQTAFALDKTHQASIVHRDLKPENLFLTEREDGYPRVKVLDFGIAKLVADAGTHANATQSLGTPLYMAPEQFRSQLGVSPATDIYSLGMVAFTFLVGTPYWWEESRKETSVFGFAMISVHGPPEAPTARARRRGVELPPAFDAWFAKATAVSPTERFKSAGAAVSALAIALGYPLAGVETSGPQVSAITAPGPSSPLADNHTSSGAALTKSMATTVATRKTVVIAGILAMFLASGGFLAFLLMGGLTSSAGVRAAASQPATESAAVTPPRETSPVPTVSASTPVPEPPASVPVVASTLTVPSATSGSHAVSSPKPPATKPAAASTAKIHSRD